MTQKKKSYVYIQPHRTNNIVCQHIYAKKKKKKRLSFFSICILIEYTFSFFLLLCAFAERKRKKEEEREKQVHSSWIETDEKKRGLWSLLNRKREKVNVNSRHDKESVCSLNDSMLVGRFSNSSVDRLLQLDIFRTRFPNHYRV